MNKAIKDAVINMVLTMANNATTKRELSVVIGKCFMSKIQEVQDFGTELINELSAMPDAVTREDILSELEIAESKFKRAKTKDTQQSYGLYRDTIMQRLYNFDHGISLANTYITDYSK